MIDTHSHLLPWLDHGCPDPQTSVVMARAAAESGVDTIVCTPHLTDWDEALIKQAGSVIEQVREAIASEGLRLRLLLGFEVDLSVVSGRDIEQLAAVTVEAAGRVIILETPYNGWPVFLEEVIFRLATAGVIPVLAHPERNDLLQRSSDPLLRCVRAGAVVQATAGSFGGTFGRTPIRAFQRMLSEGLVSLLASDAHSFIPEGWTLGPLLDSLGDRLPASDVEVLTQINPSLVLEGRMPEHVGGSQAQTSWPRSRRPKNRPA